jgi:phosphoserine phosphatase
LIEEVIARPVDVAFGNSIHDFAMMEKAKCAYAINPNPDLWAKATKLGWNVYWPEIE